MLYYVILILIGLLGGFLAGLIGIGGGIIYVLVLPYILLEMGVPESELVQFTIANSIIGTMFAGLAGNIAHIRRKEFFLKPVLITGLVGVLFSMLSLYFIVNTDWYQKEQFNPLIIALTIFIIYRTLKQAYRKDKVEKEKEVKAPFWMLTGVFGGAISALSGLGGGIIIIPLLNTGLNMTMRKAKSISLGVIFITALSITIVNLLAHPSVNLEYATMGYIVIPIALALALGVSVGSPFGVKMASRFSNRLISHIFVLFLLLVIVNKLMQIV